jgi:hypothetical protein
MNHKKILILIAVLLTSTSCTLPEHSILGHKRLFLYGVPEGDDPFSQGWRDGCDTSLATVGEGSSRVIKEQLNSDNTYKMKTDPLYNKGFDIGSGYCTNFLDYNSG